MAIDGSAQLVPGDDCNWYYTGPVDVEWLCAYHAYGCSVVLAPEGDVTPDRCEECADHAARCYQQCPSTHKDACDRYFNSWGADEHGGACLHNYLDKCIEKLRTVRDECRDLSAERYLYMGALDALQAVRESFCGGALPTPDGCPVLQAIEFPQDDADVP